MDPVRFSRLKLMGRSPAHYAAYQDLDRETVSMRIGSAAHAFLLGTEPPVTYDGPVRRGKAWDAFAAENAGRTILTAKEYEAARRIADSIALCPEALRVLEGVRETRIDWTYLGRACRSTPDVVGADFITDLKTTVSADPRKFTWQAIKMGYTAQLAFYREAVARSRGQRPAHAYIVAVESAPPYPVTVLKLTDRALDKGERLCRSWMEQLLVCEQSGQWPPYSQAVVDLDVPDDDFELTFADEEAAQDHPF